MKERFGLLFQCGDKGQTTKELTAWIREADASGTVDDVEAVHPELV